MILVPSRKTTAMARILSAGVTLALATACGQINGAIAQNTQTPPPATTASILRPYRATPISAKPAAGICAGPSEGLLTAMNIEQDVPAPSIRCLLLRPNQKLKVVNQTLKLQHVILGMFQAEIKPKGEHTFDMPLGEYLEPGVHTLQGADGFYPELWLRPELPLLEPNQHRISACLALDGPTNTFQRTRLLQHCRVNFQTRGTLAENIRLTDDKWQVASQVAMRFRHWRTPRTVH